MKRCLIYAAVLSVQSFLSSVTICMLGNCADPLAVSAISKKHNEGRNERKCVKGIA